MRRHVRRFSGKFGNLVGANRENGKENVCLTMTAR